MYHEICLFFFQVHQSLGDIFGDLQSKDLQLTLAMQDLSIATEEIKQAAEYRSRLECLERYVYYGYHIIASNCDKPSYACIMEISCGIRVFTNTTKTTMSSV